jgi:hypothetical protein
MCADQVHNFGSISETQKVEYVFVIKNEGNSILSITDARSTCGACSSVKVANMAVPPGSNTSVLASFDPRGKEGQVEHVVWLKTNDEGVPLLKLALRMSVVPELDVVPRRIFLGHISEADRSLREIIITSSTTALNLKRVECNSSGFNVSFSRKDTNKSWAVSVRPNGKLPAGRVNAVLTIHVEHSHTASIQVPIYGSVLRE